MRTLYGGTVRQNKKWQHRAIRIGAQLSKPVRNLPMGPDLLKKLVLLERFELSASPLPRECSTPEL
jgi:hypothetical protein